MNIDKQTDKIKELLQDAQSIIIMGHIRPDGDCVGSCLGLYHYITSNWRKKDQVKVILEPFMESFKILKDADKISHDFEIEDQADLVIVCDASSIDRLGDGERILKRAKRSICIDHHVTNTHYTDYTYLRGGLSAAGEAICELVDFDLVNQDTASCLYMAIAHDTGIFKFSAANEQTMCYVGKLLSKGVNQTKIIDETYNSKTYNQTRICGMALSKSKLEDENQIIASFITLEEMKKYQVTATDLDGIIDKLRVVKGVKIAVFMYETGKNKCKVSLRSNGNTKINDIAFSHGGGGHIWAAGYDAIGSLEDVYAILLPELKEKLKLGE